MNRFLDQFAELNALLESLCEDRLTADDAARLERLVLADSAARDYYLAYIDLHGTLYWDAGRGGIDQDQDLIPGDRRLRESETIFDRLIPQTLDESPARRVVASPAAASAPASHRFRLPIRFLVVASLLIAVGGIVAWGLLSGTGNPSSPTELLTADHSAPGESGDAAEHSDAWRLAERRSSPPVEPRVNVPLQTKLPKTSPDTTPKESPDSAEVADASDASRSSSPDVPMPAQRDRLFFSPDDPAAHAAVVAFIDERLRDGWNASGFVPSSRADDAEWVRRVYLDLLGRIPSADEAEDVLSDRASDKRERMIERLLNHPDHVRHLATVWTNVLIGRSDSRNVDRPALQKFLRDSFRDNRPWSEIVADLVSAEGRPDENGAANFLLAHLNNEAVPATAIVSRVFLGKQVQCTQCHDHKLNKEWKQNQFWELNSFFQQTAVLRRPRRDVTTNGRTPRVELVTRPADGPIYYETPTGLMRVAYPQFGGEAIDPGPEVNRRAELARLLTTGDDPQLARAFVNRTWAHFFGYGFTKPLDDMGPHNSPTHPELLDRLAREFVASGYDVRRLFRWITACEAYHLTSRFNPTNFDDDPAREAFPMFSRMYLRPLSVEQVYDSLLVATGAHRADAADWQEAERHRQAWLQQFVIAFDTDENDEATTFDGSVPQALMMMNGELIHRALSDAPGTMLSHVLREEAGENEQLRRLTLAALSRPPSKAELTAMKKLIGQRTARASQAASRQKLYREALEDIFWALLNSSEFAFNH